MLDYTTQADLYMDICDVLVTKPGGLTSTEAAAKGIPMVHSEPIPGCETCNTTYFEERGMSLSVVKPRLKEITQALHYLRSKEVRSVMAANQRSCIPSGASDRIADLAEQLAASI